jgi:hypothetical protein
MTLWDLKCKLDALIESKKINKYEVYGKVTLLTGELIPRIKPETSASPERIEGFRKAICQVLKVTI